MTATTCVFILGGLLMLIAVVGGGIEVRELKIPKVGAVARVLSALMGILLISWGATIHEPQLKSAPSEPEPRTSSVVHKDQESVDFVVIDQLGEGQISEQVYVTIDGKEVGTLSVNRHYPQAAIRVTVPGAGRYSYNIVTVAVFDNQGTELEYQGIGEGQINVSQGKKFLLAGSFSGSTWYTNLVEVE